MSENNFEVLHSQTGSKGMFYINSGEEPVATLTYVQVGDTKIIVDKTDVDDSLDGTGAGEKLVSAAVKWARAKEMSILPLCPFTKATIKDNPAYHSVLQDRTR